MNANENFDKLMIKETEKAGNGKKLLLHCCCAPCSSACLERLKDDFSVTVLFYNPNIETDEYSRRKNELIRLINKTGWADFIDCVHDESEFYGAVKGLETQPEGGDRCKQCFALRLEKTARLADELDFDYFTSTLTISPLKDAKTINEIGKKAEKRAKWLFSDFKKRNGFLRSTQLSEEYGLYRQNYCGCVFSRRQNP